MKSLFIGLGSIGKRHAKILKEKYKHELYAWRSGKNDSDNDLGIKELSSWDEVIKLRPDAVFITNPTSLHIDTAIRCAELGGALFIEKPIGKDTNKLDELLKIVKRKKIVTYVGYNLRFHPVIVRLKEYLKKMRPLHVRVVGTSFLPKWRPGKDYLESYSAKSDMGGGVILDLSHELDYVSYLLGPVKTISGIFSKRGKVTVDAEDYADLFISTENGPVNIHVDFLSQLKQRYVQIDFEDLTVVGDILNCEIREYRDEKLRKKYKLDYYRGQEYEDQMKYFFKNINNPKMMNNLVDASSLFKEIILFKEGDLKIG